MKRVGDVTKINSEEQIKYVINWIIFLTRVFFFNQNTRINFRDCISNNLLKLFDGIN